MQPPSAADHSPGQTSDADAGDTLARRASPPSASIVMAMRQHTSRLHAVAERSGIIKDVLRGTVQRDGYVLLLRNLHAVYQVLEAGLERHRHSPTIGGLARPELYRSANLATDLARLAGPDWRRAIKLLPAGQIYADRVADAAQGDGALLLAHAYTRFLGDLSGGRVMAGRVAQNSAMQNDTPQNAALAFYAYPDIADTNQFKAEYRAALDAAGQRIADPAPVIAEAETAFSLNIALANEIPAWLAEL